LIHNLSIKELDSLSIMLTSLPIILSMIMPLTINIPFKIRASTPMQLNLLTIPTATMPMYNPFSTMPPPPKLVHQTSNSIAVPATPSNKPNMSKKGQLNMYNNPLTFHNPAMPTKLQFIKPLLSTPNKQNTSLKSKDLNLLNLKLLKHP
jgi:hypothetical protein